MKILKTVTSVLLLIVMFISLAAGLILSAPQAIMIDLAEKVADSEYCAQMYQKVYSELDSVMGLTVLQAEDLKDILTEATIRSEAPKALRSVFSYADGSGVLYEYQNDELLERIKGLLTNFAQENQLEYDPDSAEEVYDMICEHITAEMTVVPQAYMQSLSGLIQKLGRILTWWFVPYIVFVLCAVGVFLLNRPHILRTLYRLMIPTYFASFTVFVAAFTVYRKDYLAKTVLGNEMLQKVLRSTANLMLEGWWKSALAVTIASAALAVVIILLLCKRRERI